MEIFFNAPSYPLDSVGLEKFHRDYVEPLGRGRRSIKISANEIVIESNRPGMLNLGADLLTVSMSKSIEKWQLEPVEELNPPGGWYGDLEPDSPALLLERIGLPWHSSNGFHYQVPPFRDDYKPPVEAGSIIEVTIGHYERHVEAVVDHYENDVGAVVRGNAFALVSLAKHALYLSQAPEGTKVVFGRSEGIKGERDRLVVERRRFAEDVPWAKVPSPKMAKS